LHLNTEFGVYASPNCVRIISDGVSALVKRYPSAHKSAW